jgi:hypothetical protein
MLQLLTVDRVRVSLARMSLALSLERLSWLASCVSAAGILVAVAALLLQKNDSRVQLQLAMTVYVNETAEILVEYPELRNTSTGAPH